MERLIWICIGGAAGTGARYLVSAWATQRLGGGFPYGTLLVNLGGCFTIALVMDAAAVLAWPATLRATITIGFLGGFTTYSSFNYETTRMLQEGAHGTAALNALATTIGCFAAGWLGLLCSRALVGR